MIKNTNRIFLITLFTAGAILLTAEAAPPLNAGLAAGPVEWQEVNLEDRLHAKLVQALSASVPPNQFVVTVNVVMKDKPKPSPTPTAKPQATTHPKDEITLGKLDFGAPKWTDEKEAPSSPEEVNIFKSPLMIKVSVFLDQSIPPNKKQIVQKIVENVIASIDQGAGGIQPEINIEATELVTKEPQDLMKLLIEFKLPIVILFAVLMLNLVFLIMFLGYRALEKRKIVVMEEGNKREQTKVESQLEIRSERVIGEVKQFIDGSGAPTSVSATAVVSAEEQEVIENAKRGFSKFQTLLKDSPEKAVALIKQWLRAPGFGGEKALLFMPQVLSTEEFMVIFQHLSLDDRKSWKKILNTPFAPNDAPVASTFVGSQIVDSLLAPPQTLDAELKTLISDLEVADCVDLANQNADLGGLLVNLLPSAQVSQIFSRLPSESANRVTVASLKFSDAEIVKKSPQLKEAIQAIKKQAKPQAVPFVEKAADLFAQIAPDKESSILSAMVESGDFNVLETTVKQFFPAELILKLPAALLKSCLDLMPTERRAEFIYSRPTDHKAILLDSIGKTGSKLRDLIDLEVTQVNSDPTRKRRSDRNSTAQWKTFIDLVRTRIRTQDAAAEQAEPVLDNWLFDKTGGKLGRAQGEEQGGDQSGRASTAA